MAAARRSPARIIVTEMLQEAADNSLARLYPSFTSGRSRRLGKGHRAGPQG